MQIHSLTLPKRKSKKRIGRGGRRGTTSGRGTKGQGAHNKHKSPLFEGGRSTLLDRMKKVKGFKSPKAKPMTLTLSFLDRHFEDGETVSCETILGKKLFSPKHLRGGIKVVATGTLGKKLSFDGGTLFSETALVAVKKVGCAVEEVK